MEYVEGVAVNEYGKQNLLTAAQKLKLFNKVCSAVAYAHRNLVIHGDLKPGNVLITADGEPKLLDFGISSFKDGGMAPSSAHALTPAYASPEQISGEPITTATDI
jgi:eukaryotic-like serine/threonine-protein kinase